MRTIEVTREFRDRCKDLAQKCTMPQVKSRLEKLAIKYDRDLQKLDAPSIIPKE
jgi:hypothetical protein